MAKKTRESWGSITEVKPGKRYRIRFWGRDASGTYRRMSRTVRGTKRDAEKVRAEMMLMHSDEAPCPTMDRVWESFVLPSLNRRVSEGDFSPRSLDGYSRAWKSCISPRWGDVQCDAVKPLAVQQWISGLTLSQARRAVMVMSVVFSEAVKYGFAERNPMKERYLMPAKSTVKRRDSGVWDLEELGAVWQAVHEGAPWMEPSFILAAFGSARVSESLGVLAGEVEFIQHDGVPIALVPIVRQMTKENGISDRLKTETSRRVLAIPGRAGQRLHELASALPSKSPLTHDGFNRWVNRDRLNKAWRTMVLPLLPEDQRHPYQNLRNSWQTNCRWTLGMQPYYIEALMGHKTNGVTGAHYDRPQVMMFASVVAEAYAQHRYDEGWTWLDNWDD